MLLPRIWCEAVTFNIFIEFNAELLLKVYQRFPTILIAPAICVREETYLCWCKTADGVCLTMLNKQHFE